MTVTYNDPQKIDTLAYLVSWSSDQPTPVTFRVYVQGVLTETFVSDDGTGQTILSVGIGESPFFEVLDMACQNPSIAFPGAYTLNWLSIAGAVMYSVQEYVSGSWVQRIRITDQGQGVFTFKSRWLEDSQVHQFQIVPIDAAGNSGVPISATVLQVRHPDVPNVAYALNGNGTLHITG